MSRSPLVATALAATALVAFAGPARSQKPAPSASASASPPGGTQRAAPAGTPLEKARVPTEKSPPPTATEWEGATEVALMRPLPPTCSAHLVREWLRIRCESTARGLTQISGPREGTSFYAHEQHWDHAMGVHVAGRCEVLFPLRRGERRVLELVGHLYGITGTISVSAQWLDDQPGPWVTALADAEFFAGPY